MSSLKNKTPSETYADILAIGEDFNGISENSQSITDGSGSETKIKVSKTNLDIDFNGGSISSYYLKGSECKKFIVQRIAHFDSVNILVGQPGTNIVMAYFDPDPYVEDFVYESDPYSNEDIEYQRVFINIKKPLIENSYQEIPYICYSDIYFYQARNAGNAIQLWFTFEDGQLIEGSEKYSTDGSQEEYDHIRVFLINDNNGGDCKYKVMPIKNNVFNPNE